MGYSPPQVKEDSYLAHQELQRHLESARRTPGDCEEAIHLQLAHRRELQRRAARSRGVLHKLGRWAALVDHMTLQSLVSVFQRDVRSFLRGVVKVTGEPSLAPPTLVLWTQCCQRTTEL